MTINKSQGQIAEACFHSWSIIRGAIKSNRAPKGLKVWNITRPIGLPNTIANIVYREAFNGLPQITGAKHELSYINSVSSLSNKL